MGNGKDNTRTVSNEDNMICFWDDQCSEECADWFIDCDDYDVCDNFEDDLVYYALDLAMRDKEYRSFIAEMEGDA